ncbi:Anthranilate synthase beta subunit 2, chloroplastic [Capsicum annuum]|nr:Anthranilate synthase beta subunit 2, chloroplastic [Capsicum annuum]
MAGIIYPPPSSSQSAIIHVNNKNTSLLGSSGSGGAILRMRSLKRLQTTKSAISVSQNSSVSCVELSEKDNGQRIKKSPIIVIDNYDSFTYNLCQYMGELGCNFEVYRNDELTVDELKKKNPRGILISPGPGTPQDSGISLQTVLELGPTVPLFGVCMGLQCMGEAFGGKVVRSPYGVMHGKSSPVYFNEGGEDGLFAGLSNNIQACVMDSMAGTGILRRIAKLFDQPSNSSCKDKPKKFQFAPLKSSPSALAKLDSISMPKLLVSNPVSRSSNLQLVSSGLLNCVFSSLSSPLLPVLDLLNLGSQSPLDPICSLNEHPSRLQKCVKSHQAMNQGWMVSGFLD